MFSAGRCNNCEFRLPYGFRNLTAFFVPSGGAQAATVVCAPLFQPKSYTQLVQTGILRTGTSRSRGRDKLPCPWAKRGPSQLERGNRIGLPIQSSAVVA